MSVLKRIGKQIKEPPQNHDDDNGNDCIDEDTTLEIQLEELLEAEGFHPEDVGGEEVADAEGQQQRL